MKTCKNVFKKEINQRKNKLNLIINKMNFIAKVIFIPICKKIQYVHCHTIIRISQIQVYLNLKKYMKTVNMNFLIAMKFKKIM